MASPQTNVYITQSQADEIFTPGPLTPKPFIFHSNSHENAELQVLHVQFYHFTYDYSNESIFFEETRYSFWLYNSSLRIRPLALLVAC